MIYRQRWTDAASVNVTKVQSGRVRKDDDDRGHAKVGVHSRKSIYMYRIHYDAMTCYYAFQRCDESRKSIGGIWSL